MSLRIVPITRDQSTAFIAAWHRHNLPPVGYLFALGVAIDDALVGVATVGRPVARHYDDGITVEVTRVATTGAANTCSMLYAASWRAAKAFGYARGVTYTRDDESGASLRAAGWVRGYRRDIRAGWDTPGRRRDNDGYDSVGRFSWHAGAWAATDGGRLVGSGGTSRPSTMALPLGAVAEQGDLFAELGGVAA